MSWLTSKTYLFIFSLFIVAQLTMWKLDSRVPFKMTGPPIYTHAVSGEPVKVTIPIKQDLTRDCSLLFSRYMFDSEGTRLDLQATRFVSATGIILLDKTTPNSIQISLDIPKQTAPGIATIVTQLAYMCNPLQYIWPVDHDMIFTIKVEGK